MSRSSLICVVVRRTAGFPCLVPHKSTAFNVYVREQDEGKELVKRSSTLSGETDTIEFSGSANDGGDGTGSKYVFLILTGCCTHLFWQQILPRAPSTGFVETHSAAHTSVPDFSTDQGPQELQADGNWNLGAPPSAQHAGQSIRDQKGQGGDTGARAQQGGCQCDGRCGRRVTGPDR